MANFDDIGGWPKIIDEPLHPQLESWLTHLPPGVSEEKFRSANTNYAGPDHSPSDRPHNINGRERGRFMGGGDRGRFRDDRNTYAAMRAFVEFVELGLYPPKWVLEHFTDGFRKHLDNPDPELAASQLGLTSKGSGKKSPHDRYTESIEQGGIASTFMTLISAFDISLTLAAKATIAIHGLDISEKTLVAKVRTKLGDRLEVYRLKNRTRDMYPFLPESAALGFFRYGKGKNVPASLRREILKKAPDFAQKKPNKT